MENQLEDTFKSMDFGLDLDRIVNARLIDLNSLSKEIKQKSNKLILQRIPRYMRRRAASHNPKRVPTTRFIKHPILSIGNSVIKEKRRKQRKKHVNKIKKKLSIKRRNERKERILLHIWFKKRFSLINQLDHLVPLKNNTKNFRNLHRVSINQCIYYYRPLIKLLEIKFDNEQQLNESFILMKNFLKTNLDELEEKEIDLFFYNQDQCLVPVNFLKYSKSTIWLSIPIDFYFIIQNILDKLFTKANLKFTIYECQFERFRLIGPKSIKNLENLFNSSTNQTSTNQTSTNRTTTNQTSTTKISLVDLNDGNKFVKIITECNFLNQQSNQINSPITILLKDKSKFIIDVLVQRNQAKKFWYNLVKNKGHLVGGKIDYEYYALQNNLICYPSFGYLDLPIHKDNSKFKLIKSIIELIDNQSDQESNELIKNPTLERSNEFLNLCESSFENLNKIKQYYNKESFINVKLEAIKKGTLKENDLIYLPTQEDLIQLEKIIKMSKEDRFANHIDEESPLEQIKLKKLMLTDDSYLNLNKLKSILQMSNRKVIGIVEIGNYCLKSGKSEAFGIVSTHHLINLIELTINSNVTHQLNVLIRSQNNSRFRFCKMQIKKFNCF